MKWETEEFRYWILTGLIALLAFWRILDFSILNPLYTDWIMKGGDLSTHYLGWEFFRKAPLFQWPFGANWSYGMEVGSSIVFTDSIPLMAFSFKLLNPIIPVKFQYFGIWILLCFILQIYTAFKLISLLTKEKIYQIPAVLFFAITPFFLYRLEGHFALMAHWSILFALYFFLRDRFSDLSWFILLCLTALIHAYLLILVLSIYIFDLLSRGWHQELSIKQILKSCSMSFSGTLFVMWFAGYFILPSEVQEGGFGIYKMNLLSLINPGLLWSYLLPAQKVGIEFFEGFNYLGIGMLILGFFALIKYIKDGNFKISKKGKILLLLSSFLFIYSISNQIVFGIKVIFNYSIPSFLKRLTGIFRVSGRFFWPVSYLLYFSIFFILYRTKRIRRISLIISFVWFLQVIDSSKIVSHYGKLYSEKKEYTSLFHSKSWKELAKPYQKLRIVLPKKNPENWMNLADYALRNNLSINAGYFARVNSEAMASSQKEILEAIIRGRYHKDSLYIFQEKALLEEAILHLSENDLAGMKDGIFLLAPGLKSKKDALGVKEYEYNDLEYYNLSMNEKVLFNSKGSGQRYRFIGWSDPEHWGVWSNNDFSTLNFHLPEGIGDNVILSLESKAFINHLHPVLRVDVFMNNRFMQTLEYTISDNERIRKIRIPKSFLYVKKKSPNRLRFNYNSPKSPAELGISADGRRLGMGLISLSIEK